MDDITPRTSERALGATDGESLDIVTDGERTDSATILDEDNKAMTQAEAVKMRMVYQISRECRRRTTE